MNDEVCIYQPCKGYAVNGVCWYHGEGTMIPRIHCCVASGATGATRCLYCGNTIRWLDNAPRGYRCCDCQTVMTNERGGKPQ